MDMDSLLWKLVLVFAPLSVLSFGGGQVIVSDIQLQTVQVHHWLTNQQFADLFAISRAAPGPSTLISSLIGYQISGFIGAIVATLAMYIPSSTVFVITTSLWHRHHGSRWRIAIERGLAPIAVGLIFASAIVVLQAIHIGVLGWCSTLASALLLYFTKINPYLLMLAVALFYTAVFFLK
ncbi:MAG: Chromate transport protein [Herbaspirillum sp.]|jgi:chromate transporter|nr:Chromate transport protein [Herbaspirillum sp.]